jgi:hypothetical protein
VQGGSGITPVRLRHPTSVWRCCKLCNPAFDRAGCGLPCDAPFTTGELQRVVLLSSRSGLIPINPTHPDVPLLSGVSRVRARQLFNRAKACPAVKARSPSVCPFYVDLGAFDRLCCVLGPRG